MLIFLHSFCVYLFNFSFMFIVLFQFHKYLRSLSIDPFCPTTFRFVTDGQLPLRQCLHPESSSKDFELPAYYCRFVDLRKEMVRFKSGDLSRALIPIKDISKLPQMQLMPVLPQSIEDIMKGMNRDEIKNR